MMRATFKGYSFIQIAVFQEGLLCTYTGDTVVNKKQSLPS